MELNKKTVRMVALAAFSVLAGYWCLQNLTLLEYGMRGFLGLLAPFLVGCVIAFVLNVPMRAVERHLIPGAKKMEKLRRPLAFLLTLALMAGVLGLASLVIVPNLGDAISSVIFQARSAVIEIPAKLAALEARFPELQRIMMDMNININWAALSEKIINLLQNVGNGLVDSSVGIVGGVVSGVSSFVIGLVFAIYVLLQKEKLGLQSRLCLYALLPEKAADWILEVLALANRTFTNFLSGQCLEAIILGTLFTVSMTIFRMPYALLVGVLIALSALIPIVGAFIGCGIGALLILLVDPWKALLFIILFLVLQQIEGNLIYPHVVGSSVGLPSIWVLAAVTVGGKLMGITGMILFIPLCSVAYSLFRRFIKKRLAGKRIAPEKLKPPQKLSAPENPKVAPKKK